MKVSTSELKLFNSNSSPVVSSHIIPITSFLKFQNGTLTKNSLHSFIVQKVSCQDNFLVDEKILMTFVKNTLSKEIDIKLIEKEVVEKGELVVKKYVEITDGYTKVKSPTADINFYPVNNNSTDDPYTISAEEINSLAVASKFILKEDTPTARSFVFVGRSFIAGQNGAVGYTIPIDSKAPEMVLTSQMLNAITKFSEVEFTQNDSYNFFDCGVCKYGFAKSEIKFLDVTRPAKFEKKGLPMFTVNGKEVGNFNNLCISTSSSKIKSVSMVMDDDLKLEMNDNDYEINISKSVSAIGCTKDVFFYSPDLLNIVIDNVGDDLLTFYQDVKNSCYYITGESGFVSLLMGMAPTQTN